jgi:hypothetical protein
MQLKSFCGSHWGVLSCTELPGSHCEDMNVPYVTTSNDARESGRPKAATRTSFGWSGAMPVLYSYSSTPSISQTHLILYTSNGRMKVLPLLATAGILALASVAIPHGDSPLDRDSVFSPPGQGDSPYRTFVDHCRYWPVQFTYMYQLSTLHELC